MVAISTGNRFVAAFYTCHHCYSMATVTTASVHVSIGIAVIITTIIFITIIAAFVVTVTRPLTMTVLLITGVIVSLSI